MADLDASILFYSSLFGVQPHKVRPGYANFAIAEPPLKVVPIEAPAQVRGEGAAGALNHLGVEVGTVDEVDAGRRRLVEAGLVTVDEEDTSCCYARQNKVWVHDPAGAPWEIYTIVDDNPTDGQPATASLPLLVDDVEDQAPCCTPPPTAPSHETASPAGCCSRA